MISLIWLIFFIAQFTFFLAQITIKMLHSYIRIMPYCFNKLSYSYQTCTLNIFIRLPDKSYIHDMIRKHDWE